MALIDCDWGYVTNDRELGRPCYNNNHSPRCVHTCCVWIDTTHPRFDFPERSEARARMFYCATCLVQQRFHIGMVP